MWSIPSCIYEIFMNIFIFAKLQKNSHMGKMGRNMDSIGKL